jgi:competence protein ComEC
MYRKINQLLLAVITLGLIFALVVWRQWPSQDLKLVFCDVGQGDAIILIQGSFQLVIDGGPNNDILKCLGKHMPFWDRQIEWVVLTHGHADHVTGLVPVLEKYRVNLIMTNGSSYESAILEEFYDLASRQVETGGSKWVVAREGQVGYINDRARVKVLSPEVAGEYPPGVLEVTETILSDVTRGKYGPPVGYKNNENDLSIVLLIEFDGVRVLLTGDLEAPGEQALLRKGLIQEVDILKVGHHGSKTSSAPSLIEATRPELAVISVGKNNRYQHPAPEVITTLEKAGARVWRTDEQGTLEVIIKSGRFWQVFP